MTRSTGTSKRFERGELRALVLELLGAGPLTGADIKREVEHRHPGTTVSGGSVYPLLYRLAARGYLTKTSAGRRELYELTPVGREALAEKLI